MAFEHQRVPTGISFELIEVALTGKVLTMPGLPKVPAAEGIDYDEKEERITGLF